LGRVAQPRNDRQLPRALLLYVQRHVGFLQTQPPLRAAHHKPFARSIPIREVAIRRRSAWKDEPKFKPIACPLLGGRDRRDGVRLLADYLNCKVDCVTAEVV